MNAPKDADVPPEIQELINKLQEMGDTSGGGDRVVLDKVSYDKK